MALLGCHLFVQVWPSTSIPLSISLHGCSTDVRYLNHLKVLMHTYLTKKFAHVGPGKCEASPLGECIEKADGQVTKVRIPGACESPRLTRVHTANSIVLGK